MVKRIPSIDIVRGLVMVIMALDHIRELLHTHAITNNPVDLATTTPALFASRWITHLCAPTFVFLSGVSVYLSARRKTLAAMRRFLITRGLWLILLEFTIINFMVWFDVHFRILMLQVIAAIGAGFIVLALLLKLPPRVLGWIGLLIIFLHNLLQFVPPSESSFLNVLRNILFTPGIQNVSPHFQFFTAYPIVPWIAIMLVGYSFARVYDKEEKQRNQVLFNTGIAALGLFVLLRLVNIYGDPAPWSQQKNFLFSVLSFFNVTKYPPSLLFILLFLGICCMLLRFAESWPKGIQKLLSIYGQVPMFYYLLHWMMIRITTIILIYAQGFTWGDMQTTPFGFGRPAAGFGLGLVGVLVIWVVIVALLYPLCKWYAGYKKNHPSTFWSRYL